MKSPSCPGIQQDRDRLTPATVRHDEVRPAVAIEVARRDAAVVRAAGKRLWGREGSVPVAREHADSVVKRKMSQPSRA